MVSLGFLLRITTIQLCELPVSAARKESDKLTDTFPCMDAAFFFFPHTSYHITVWSCNVGFGTFLHFLVEWMICLARLWTPSDCAPPRLWLFLSHRRRLASAAALIPHQSLSETVPPLGIWSFHIDSQVKYRCMISVLKGQCGSGYCIYGRARYRTGKEKKH